MEFHRIKMENLKQRLMNGETVKKRGFEHGDYVIHLTNEPAILFDDNCKNRADKVLQEFHQLQ
jgi:hypothetical protein